MAVSYVGVNAAAGQVAGVTTPAGVASITATLPARGTVANPRRVFVGQAHSCATGSATTPAGWTVLGTKDTVIGTGAPSAAGGQRFMTIYYRDDDGSWSAPVFDLASATQNSHAIAVITLAKDLYESWDTPTISGDGEYFGTAGTAFSAATPSAFSTTAKAFLMAFSCTNDNVTSTAGAITGSGFVSGTVTERVDGGTATGNDVAVKLHTCSPTTGANVVLTHTQTLSAASQGGWLAVHQTVTYTGSTPPGAWLYDNFRDPDATALTAHTGEQGATWAGQTGWVGSGSIQKNHAYTGSGAMLAQTTPPSANYEVTATVTIVSKVSGEQLFIMGRAPESGGTFYGALLYTSDGVNYALFCRYITGFSVGADMGTTSLGNLVLGSSHTVSLRMDGTQLSATFDATVIGPFTNSSLTAVGKAGFGEWSASATATTGVHLESIMATPYPTATPAAAGFTGTGALTATATPEYDRDAAFTGSGALSTVISPIQTSTPGLSGSGVLSATATASYASTAALSGSGVLSATANPAVSVDAALSGLGVLSATATRLHPMSAPFTGAGALTVTATAVYASTAALSGSGVLSATFVPTLPAALAGSGVLSATATIVASEGEAAAAFTSSGALTATVSQIYSVTATLTGAGTLTAIAQGVTLLGEWGFLADTYQDTSGNGRHGTLTTGSPTFVTGPQANTRGIKFSSANDVVTISRTGLEPSADGLTLMGWVRFESTSAATGYLGVLSKARAGASTRHRIGMVNTTATREGNAVARWKDDLHLENMGSWSGDDWHHVALVDGNTKWRMYLDGTLYDNGTRAFDNSTSPTWSAHDWIVGRNSTIGDVNAHTQMSVSGIRIFQGELSDAEITTWMNTPIEGGTPASASFAGAGVLSATATPEYDRDAALAGSGTLSATVSQIYPITAALTGTGSLTATATRLHPMSAVLSGSGVLSATFVPTLSAALAGVGALSVAINQIHPRAAALTGAGVLSATATAVYARTATLTGTGVTTTVVSQIYPLTVTLTGTGTLTATTQQIYPIAAVLAGTGSLTAVTAVPGITSGALTGSGALTATISQIQTVTAPLTGTGVLSATFTPLLPALLSGAGALSATIVPQLTADRTGTGTLTATIKQIYPIAANLAGSGTLTAVTATAGTTTGAFTSSGALSATFSQKYTLTAALTGSGLLVGGIAGTGTITAALSGSGSLTATVAPLFTPTLSGAGSLTAIAIATGGATTALSGSGTLSASVVPIYRITAIFTGTGALSATTQIVVEAFHPYPDAVFTVRAENTTITIKAENAAITVKAENDTATIKAENIGFTVKPANTALIVKPDNNLLTV